MIQTITQEVQRILNVLDPNSIFLRANDAEANTESTRITVGDNILVQMYDEDSIEVGDQDSIYPLALRFLYKTKSQDETQEEIDELVHLAEVFAKKFLYQLQISPIRSFSQIPVEGATYDKVTANGNGTIHDEIFAGIDFTVDFPVQNFVQC